MSAKKSSPRGTPAAPATAPAGPAATAGTGAVPAPTAAAPAEPSWLDSADPRRRLVGRIALVGLSVYVAALWLLALDQWLGWGIFGPKVPPIP